MEDERAAVVGTVFGFTVVLDFLLAAVAFFSFFISCTVDVFLSFLDTVVFTAFVISLVAVEVNRSVVKWGHLKGV